MFRQAMSAALAWAAVSCSPEAPDEDSGSPRAADPSMPFANRVAIRTELGDIVLRLDPERAPRSVAAFLEHLDSGYYDTAVFHRVIDGYLIEGGLVRREGERLVEHPSGDPVPNEARNGLPNVRGSVAMARSAKPDSARAAFFINLGDNIALNHPQPDGFGYAVFGQVVSGMDIADRIGAGETGIRPLTLLHPATGESEAREVAEVPLRPVAIIRAERLPD